MSTTNDNFWIEVEIETTLAELEERRQTIINHIPHGELYGISGEINPNTRWGAVLWSINRAIADLRSLGF